MWRGGGSGKHSMTKQQSHCACLQPVLSAVLLPNMQKCTTPSPTLPFHKKSCTRKYNFLTTALSHSLKCLYIQIQGLEEQSMSRHAFQGLQRER